MPEFTPGQEVTLTPEGVAWLAEDLGARTLFPDPPHGTVAGKDLKTYCIAFTDGSEWYVPEYMVAARAPSLSDEIARLFGA